MRKIEQGMIEAIKARKYYSKDNTRVIPDDENIRTRIYLHDNEIAYIEDSELWISDCGYQTKTTKSRLNSILSHFNLPTITQQKNQWYTEGGKYIWYGSKTFDINKKDAEPQPREFDVVLGGQSQPKPYDAVLGSKKERKERFDKCLKEIVG